MLRVRLKRYSIPKRTLPEFRYRIMLYYDVGVMVERVLRGGVGIRRYLCIRSYSMRHLMDINVTYDLDVLHCHSSIKTKRVYRIEEFVPEFEASTDGRQSTCVLD